MFWCKLLNCVPNLFDFGFNYLWGGPPPHGD